MRTGIKRYAGYSDTRYKLKRLDISFHNNIYNNHNINFMIFKNLKIYFSVVCFMLMCMNIYAQQNTLEKAQSIAAQFFSQSGPSARAMAGYSDTKQKPSVMWSSTSISKSQQKKSRTFSANEEPTFYMFANPNGSGFALISGDNVARPLIGYSFDNNPASFDELPENMIEYLLGIDEQIKVQRSNYTSHKVGPTTSITSLGNIKVQLETAKWGQRDPFNRDCYNPQGQKCITGCVPTAYAIVLRYHEWPLSGKGMVNNNGQWGTTQRDISNNVYDWTQMPLNYVEGQYTDEQAEQVSQLMYDLGCACLVDYGPSATGGNPSTSMMNAVQEHFGYKNGRFEKKDWGKYSDEQWAAALRNDLDAGRPIPYAATRVGNSAAPDAKHMFVVDGYTDNNYFHFNWGWYGSCNGFYTLGEMTPNTNGSYSQNHIAVFNFTPDRQESFTISVSSKGNGSVYIGDAYTCTSRTVTRGTEVELHAKPSAGYDFANWTLNGMVVSQNENFTVSVNENAEYVANFVKAGGTATGTWYYVKFLNYDKYLTAENIGSGLMATDKKTNEKGSQLWEFVEKSGKFEIRNQNNIYLCISSSVSGSRNRKVETAEVYLDYTPTEKKFKKERWNRNGGGERIFFYGEINDFPLSILSDNRVAFVRSNEGGNINVVLEKAEITPDVPPVVSKHKVTLTGNARTRVLMFVDGKIISSGSEITDGADVKLSFTLNNNEEAEVKVGSNAPVIVTGTSYIIKNIHEDTNINVDIRKKPEPKVTVKVNSANNEYGFVYIGDSQTTTSVTVNKGEEITIHAAATKGVFTGWTSTKNTMVITEKDFTFTADNDVEYIANFKEPEIKTFPVYLTTNYATKVSMFVDGKPFGGGNIKAGSDIVLHFSMNTSEKAVVTVNGEKTAEVTGTSYTIRNVQSELNIDVQIKKYQLVNVSAISSGNGTVYINGTEQALITVERGSEVTIGAVADEGYLFDNWSINGEAVSSNAELTFKADKSVEYVANFKEEAEEVSEVYYAVRFCERKGLLTSKHDGSVTASTESYTSQDDQLWSFIPTEEDGHKYYLRSKSGRYLKLAQRRGDAAITTTEITNADVFYYMLTKDYDRWQHPAYAGSYLLVKDHPQRYCLEESSETPGKVIGYNQPWEYTELYFEPRTVSAINNQYDTERNVVSSITENKIKRDGKIYDLNGRKIEKLVRGRAYIKNGVKFIAK